jgi:cyclophilin family peptidyl-prolyl cis-trans isomerase
MYKIILLLVPVVLVAAGGYWFFSSNGAIPEVTNSPQAATTSQEKIMQVENTVSATLHTNKGDITIEFFSSDAPNTVANFIKLAQSGYYDGTKFHRVIKGFMDQGGDPLTKDDSKIAQWGTGGPGYQFADENVNANNAVGVVSMANAGPNTNGSQFFINAADNNVLDGKYSVFGKVVEGLDVVMAINNTPTDPSDRPITPVVISSVTLK